MASTPHHELLSPGQMLSRDRSLLVITKTATQWRSLPRSPGANAVAPALEQRPHSAQASDGPGDGKARTGGRPDLPVPGPSLPQVPGSGPVTPTLWFRARDLGSECRQQRAACWTSVASSPERKRVSCEQQDRAGPSWLCVVTVVSPCGVAVVVVLRVL